MKAIFAHARDQVLAQSKNHCELLRDLEQVVIRCLAKTPRDRCQNVECLDHALAQCESTKKWTQVRTFHWRQAISPPKPGFAQATVDCHGRET